MDWVSRSLAVRRSESVNDNLVVNSFFKVIRMNPVTFFVVNVIEDDECVVLPSTWVNNGEAFIPKFGLEEKAERREVVKGSWPVSAMKILSHHSKYSYSPLTHFLEYKTNVIIIIIIKS